MEKEYFENVRIFSKIEECEFLKSTKNTGKMAENYIENILKNLNIKYIKHKRIKTINGKFIIPDFVLEELKIILEVKCRSYNVQGTASEKIDNIPRKYSVLKYDNNFKDYKILVVFCGAEIIYQKELIQKQTEYSIDFCNLCKKYNVIDFISVEKIHQYLCKKEKINVKPFLKWAGGKAKLSDIILNNFPETYNNYHELFIGGGAIFFKVLALGKKCFISDINSDLINCYSIIKNRVEDLIIELRKESYSNDKESYLKNREKFNEDSASNPIVRCALFIYLNKCCFNGLYRVNNSGKFNVPFGDMKNPTICDDLLLREISNSITDVQLEVCSFLDAKEICPGDLVYLDPPYHGTFSGYQQSKFEETEHINLKNYVDILTKNGVKVVISNSSTDFIKNLWSEYKLIEIDSRYTVGKNRSISKELLIKNF